MSKIHYLNNHLERFREKSEVKVELEDLRGLAHYHRCTVRLPHAVDVY